MRIKDFTVGQVVYAFSYEDIALLKGLKPKKYTVAKIGRKYLYAARGEEVNIKTVPDYLLTGFKEPDYTDDFLEENIENQTEYEFWNGSGWIKGNETAATPLFNDISGELSIAYHPEFKKWILLYFNSTRYDISFRTADHIIGEWSKPQKLVDGWQYSQLYGSYIHPISLKGNILYFIMSMWLPYNTYLMSAELKCNP